MYSNLTLQQGYVPVARVPTWVFFAALVGGIGAIWLLPAMLYGLPLVILLMVMASSLLMGAYLVRAYMDYLLFAAFVISTIASTVIFEPDQRSGFAWPLFTYIAFATLGMMVYKQENEGILQRINHFLPQLIMYPSVVIAEALTEQTGKLLAVYWIASVCIPLFWAGQWAVIWARDKVYRQREGLWFIGMIVLYSLLHMVSLENVASISLVRNDRIMLTVAYMFGIACWHVVVNFAFVINSGTYVRLGRAYKSVRTPNIEVALFTLPVALIIDAFQIPYWALIIICVGTIIATLTILASFHSVHDANTVTNDDLLQISKIDVLTGLTNVQGLITELKPLRDPFNAAVMFINIDNDLRVRDMYGQRFGDSLCMQVAQNLKENGRETEILARIRGNTFLLMSENLPFKDVYSTCLRLKSNLNKVRMHAEPSGAIIQPDIGIVCYSVKNIQEFTAIIEAANVEHEFPQYYGDTLGFEIAM